MYFPHYTFYEVYRIYLSQEKLRILVFPFFPVRIVFIDLILIGHTFCHTVLLESAF